MYYIYKRYGRWKLPIWAKDIKFDAIKSFGELQEILFDNFKKYTTGLVPAEPFLIHEYVTMPTGWPIGPKCLRNSI